MDLLADVLEMQVNERGTQTPPPMGMYKWAPLNPIQSQGGALFLGMEILAAFLLVPHPHEISFLFSNIGCRGKNYRNV